MNEIGDGRYIVKLNEKSYVKGKGYIHSTDLYRHPYHVEKLITNDVADATIFRWKEQAEEVVNEYGGTILQITTNEV